MAIELRRHGQETPESIPLIVPAPGLILVPAEWSLSDVECELVVKEAHRFYDSRKSEIETAVRNMGDDG